MKEKHWGYVRKTLGICKKNIGDQLICEGKITHKQITRISC